MVALSVYIFAAFIAVIEAQDLGFGGCPSDVPVQSDFDPSRFMGRWYEQKNTGRFDIFEANQKCVAFDFTDEKKGIVTLESKKVGKFFGGVTNGVITFKPDEPGHYVSSSYEYKVVSTDYTSYAIVFACDNTFLSHKSMLWIFSRDRTVDLDAEAAVSEKLQELGIPEGNLKKTIQSGCD